jgi:uncharacterized protein YecE (DUF72 family)
MGEMAKVHIGTSGWHYDHWRGPFYPDDLPAKERLDFYAAHFDTVEINNSFYRLPTPEAVKHWRASVPKGFLFAVKASRYTTHVKRLKDAPASFEKFFASIKPLGRKCGPILFQTPPKFKPDFERLEAFIQALPKRRRYAFEFRDTRWFDEKICAILAKRNCAFCIFEIGGLQSPLWRSADFVYLRLHGPGAKYEGSYSDRALEVWAQEIRAWLAKNTDVYCYFDNDQAGYAVKDALRLRQLVEKAK